MPVIRPEIVLSDDNLDTLTDKLRRMANAAQEYQGSWPQLHDQYTELYLGKTTPTNWPWPNAHAVHIPMIMVAVDALSSLIGDAILADRPQVSQTQDINSDLAYMLDKFYFEYIFRQHVSLRLFGNNWNKNMLIDGVQVAHPSWSTFQTIVREEYQEVRERERTEDVGIGKLQVPDEPEIVTRERVLTRAANRLRLEIPDMSRVFVAPGTDPGVAPGQGMQYPHCPWYYVETHWDQETLRSRQAQTRYGEAVWRGIDDDMLGSLTQPDTTERERSLEDQEQISSTRLPSEPVRIYYMRQVLPGEYQVEKGVDRMTGEPKYESRTQRFDDPRGVPEEIVVWYFPRRHTISRIVPLTRIKPDAKRPHVDIHYNRMSGFFHSLGIPAKIRHINRLYNKSVKQQMDFGELVNTPFGFYDSSMGILPNLTTIRPGALIPTSGGNVNFPHLPSNPSFWEFGKQTAQIWYEKITNVTDTLQGRNPSLPQASRTFRGMATQISQSQQFVVQLTAELAESYHELLRQCHSVIQRNAPQEMGFEYTAKGVVNRGFVSRDVLRHNVDFIFEVNPNRLSQQQQAQQLFGLMASIPFVAQSPKLVRGWAREIYKSFGDIDKFDRLWPEEMILVQEQQIAAQMGQQGGQPGANGQPQVPQQPPFNPLTPFQGLDPMTGTESDIGVAI